MEEDLFVECVLNTMMISGGRPTCVGCGLIILFNYLILSICVCCVVFQWVFSFCSLKCCCLSNCVCYCYWIKCCVYNHGKLWEYKKIMEINFIIIIFVVFFCFWLNFHDVANYSLLFVLLKGLKSTLLKLSFSQARS